MPGARYWYFRASHRAEDKAFAGLVGFAPPVMPILTETSRQGASVALVTSVVRYEAGTGADAGLSRRLVVRAIFSTRGRGIAPV